MATVVIVLVMVGEIDHPTVLDLRRLVEEAQPDLFQTVGMEAPSVQTGDGTLQTPGIIVIEAAGVDALVSPIGDIGLAHHLNLLAWLQAL